MSSNTPIFNEVLSNFQWNPPPKAAPQPSAPSNLDRTRAYYKELEAAEPTPVRSKKK